MVAVSADPAEGARDMQEEIGAEYPLYRDPDRSAIKTFGVYHEEVDVARPAVFVIAAGGDIRYRYVGDDQADRPPVEKLLEQARAVAD